MPGNSVEPLNDGINIAPRLAQIADGAQDFLFLTIWGLDVEMGWSGVTASSPPLIGDKMKASAYRMAKKMRSAPLVKNRSAIFSRALYLVWDMTLDDVYSPKNTDLGKIGVVEAANWNVIRTTNKNGLPDALLSGESEDCLWDIRHYMVNDPVFTKFRQGQGANFKALFPSGVTGYVQINDDFSVSNKLIGGGGLPKDIYLGSHHQKYLISEHEAYVGGFNFLKEYWDTPNHLFDDVKRASSEGNPVKDLATVIGNIATPAILIGAGWASTLFTASILLSNSGPISGNLHGALHDTGTIVRGDALQQVNEAFRQRWENCEIEFTTDYDGTAQVAANLASRKSPYNAYLKQLEFANYPTAIIDEIAKIVNKYARARAGKIGTGTSSSTPNPAFAVDTAQMLQTLPNNSLHQIYDMYIDKLGSLKQEDSFFYAESQYFTQIDLAKAIRAAYYLNGHDPHFCFIVLPYTPATHWSDIGGHLVQRGIVESEFKLLKWLEILSAQIIYFRDQKGNWVPKFKCDAQAPNPTNPQYHRIYFSGKSVNVNDNPTLLQLDSEITICNPIFLDTNGNVMTMPCPGPTGGGLPVPLTVAKYMTKNCLAPDNTPGAVITCTVNDIMTDSDIMAYALVSSGVPNVGKQKAIRNIMRDGHIYVHSKSACFCTGSNETVDWATTGSANLNERSLIDVDKHTDSELNVVWSHAFDVNNWRAKLWGEHMGKAPVTFTKHDPIGKPEKDDWVQHGWNNFQVLHQNLAVKTVGHVVRMDVADRYRDLCLGIPEPATSNWNPPYNK